jgi:3-phosphoshikimate 1-carboxyvinyltransferase
VKRTVVSAPALRGELRVPGDKSISHRAAIFNAVARGSARVDNFLPGADCLSTLACLRRLGVRIDEEPVAGRRALSLVVHGREHLAEPDDVLDAGNSGTTTRLLTGLLAGQPLFAVITGDASLRSRPMARVIAPLREMGARIDGRGDGTRAPLAIRGGALRGITYALPVASAQVKSALLLAGLQAEGETALTEPARSRDHSERLLAAMGARLSAEGATARVVGPSALEARDIQVPGDFSSAAFWLVAAAIHPRAELTVRDVGLNPTRTGLLDALRDMGAHLRVENVREVAGEPVGDVTASSSTLHGAEFGGELIPRAIDEFPALAVAAAFAGGTTVVRDAAELRVKETDRIATLAAELRRFGVGIEELPDGFAISGGRPLRGANADSHGDHRLAMALAILGLAADGETIVDDAAAVEVSYPGFWEDLGGLAR